MAFSSSSSNGGNNTNTTIPTVAPTTAVSPRRTPLRGSSSSSVSSTPVAVPTPAPTPNLVRPCGRTSSSCGYCHGTRHPPLSGASVPPSGSGSDGGARSYGALFDRLHPSDYGYLIDGGWRRSGRYLYLPDNSSSCCPHYTIRLTAADFRPDRAHRRTLNRMGRYLAGEPSGGGGKAGALPPAADGAGAASVELERAQALVAAAAVRVLKGWRDRGVALEFPSLGMTTERVASLCRLKMWKGGGKKATRPSSGDAGGGLVSAAQCRYTCSVARALAGMSRGSVDADSLAVDILRQLHCTGAEEEGKQSCDSVAAVAPNFQADGMGFILVDLERVDDSDGGAATSPVANDLPVPSDDGSRKILTVTSVPSRISFEMPDVHALYAKYQHMIHGDADPYATENEEEDDGGNGYGEEDEETDSGDSNGMDLVEEKEATERRNSGPRPAHMESPARATDHVMQQQRRKKIKEERIKKSKSAFFRFLCDPPFPPVGGGTEDATAAGRKKKRCEGPGTGRMEARQEGSRCNGGREELSGWGSAAQLSKDNEGYDVHIPYGSYHQQYRLGGTLVAVGVVDVLPRCLSSVYAFYDPVLSRVLNLGKYTALREIEWVRRASVYRPDLKYYYLGYYIHSCPKMRYKADFRPSSLRCPVTGTWVLFECADPRIEAAAPHHHACLVVDSVVAPEVAGPGVNGGSGDREEKGLDQSPRKEGKGPMKKLRKDGKAGAGRESKEGYFSDAAASTSPQKNLSSDGFSCEGESRDGIDAELKQTLISNAAENLRLDIGYDMDEFIRLSMLNLQGKRIVKPIVKEFIDSVGIDVAERCVLKLS